MGLLGILTLIANAAGEANVAIPTIFGIIQYVRSNWPHKTTDPNDPNAPPVPTDAELVALMRTIFSANHTRNLELQAEIAAGTIPPPAA